MVNADNGLTTFLAAILPGLVIVWYANSRNHPTEEWRTLARAFLVGILTVIPVSLMIPTLRALLAAFPPTSGSDPLTLAFGRAFFTAALPEETCKFAATFALLALAKGVRRPLSPLVIGLTVALGFATLENLLYVTDEGPATAVIRAMTAIPCHGALGAIMGAYLSEGFYQGGSARYAAFAKALLLPILLHGLYNFPLMASYGAELPNNGREAVALTMLTLLLLTFWARFVFQRLARLPAIAA